MSKFAKRAEYVDAYRNRSGLLFAYTRSRLPVLDRKGQHVRAGNSWSAAFWAGYDGLTSGPRVPPKNSIAWPCYDAGRLVVKLEYNCKGD